MRNSINPDTQREIWSALMVAMVFGAISPKIRISSVKIPVAIPAPTLPKRSMAMEVAREEAYRFTTLLPMRIADSIFPWFSVTRSTLSAFLFPASDRVRMRILLTVVSAVSVDENIDDKINRITKAIICDMSPASKINYSFFYKIVIQRLTDGVSE